MNCSLVLYVLTLFVLLSTGCSIETKIKLADKSLKKQKYDVALKRFNKLKNISADYRISKGIAKVYLELHLNDSAIFYLERQLDQVNYSDESFLILCELYLEKRDTLNAINTLSRTYNLIGYDSLRMSQKAEGLVSRLQEKLFFRNWKEGKRRAKVVFVESYTDEADKLTQNDQFILVINEGKILYCSEMIEDKDFVVWENADFVFEFEMSKDVRILLCDADYVYHDVLLDYKGKLPQKVAKLMHKNTYLKLEVLDSDLDVTNNTNQLPSAVNNAYWLRDLGLR